MITRPLELVDSDSVLSRLMSRVVPDGDCERWTGYTSPSGHGSLNVKTTTGRWAAKVHRVRWTIERGPIPDGLVLDHLCGNQACVNLDHLEVVTQATNARRAIPTPPDDCIKCGASDWMPHEESRVCRPCTYKRRKAWYRDRVGEITCPRCGTEFHRTRERMKYCSTDCATAQRREGRARWMRENYHPSR